MHVYRGVRSCLTKTYYTLTNGKVISNQLYLSLIFSSQPPVTLECYGWRDCLVYGVVSVSDYSIRRELLCAQAKCR